MLPSERYYELTGRKYVYNIMPIENIPSVMAQGILCYDEMERMGLAHTSIALEGVQKRREAVNIPNGNSLHQYANLYFSYNNPMLSKKREEAHHLCILAISGTVLDLEGCVVSDRNAATSLARFYTPAEGLEKINFDIVHTRYWTHDNPFVAREHRAIKCAEVLVPIRVPAETIVGACVVSEEIKQQLIANGFDKEIYVRPKLFFKKGG